MRDNSQQSLLERIIRRNQLPAEPHSLHLHRSLRKSPQPPPIQSNFLPIRKRLPALQRSIHQAEDSSIFATETAAIQAPSFRRRIISTKEKVHETQVKDRKQIDAFISAIEEREWMSEEFCYMNKGDHFYDWRMSSFQGINPRQYMVVGLRGLTLHTEDGAELFTRQQFERQSRQFEQVRQIPFFNRFFKCKVYLTWNHNAKRKNYLFRSNLVADKVFILFPFISEGLLRVEEILSGLNCMVAFSKQGIGVVSLEGLKERLSDGQVYVEQEFRDRMVRITELVKKYCEYELERFKIENNLLEDGIIASFEHTRKAIIEDQHRNLINFVKRVDYAFFSCRKQFIEQSYSNLHGILRHFKQNITMNPILKLTCQSNFTLQPSQQSLIQVFQDYPRQLFDMFSNTRQKIMFSRVFDQYRGGVRPSRKQRQEMQIPVDFQNWQCEGWGELKRLLEACWSQLQREIKPWREYYVEWEELMKISFQGKLQSQVISTYLKDHETVRHHVHLIPQTYSVSMFFLSMQQTRQEIISQLQTHHDYLTRLLPEKLMQEIAEAHTACDSIQEMLTAEPANVWQYVDFMDMKAQQQDIFADLREKILELEEVLHIVEKGKVHVSTAVSQMREAVDRMFAVEKRINDLRKSDPDKRTKFLKEVEQLSLKYQDDLTELQNSLEDIPTSAIAPSPLATLLEMKDQIHSLSTHITSLHEVQKRLALDLTPYDLKDFLQKHTHTLQLWTNRDFWQQTKIRLRGLKLAEVSLAEMESLLADEIRDRSAGEEGWQLVKPLTLLTAIESTLWTEAEQIIGRKDLPNIEIAWLEEQQVWKHSEQLQVIVERSNEQQKLGRRLTEIQSFWSENSFDIKKIEDAYSLGDNLSLLDKLEGEKEKLLEVKRNRYSARFRRRIERQNTMHGYMLQLLEGIEYHNRLIQNIGKVFTSHSAQNSMSKDYKQYQTIYNWWTKTLKSLYQNSSLKKWVEDYQQKHLLHTLQQNIQCFEGTLLASKQFLESKRKVCPRLYLLNDQQLLKLITECFEPKALDNFLATLFNSLQRLVYDQNFVVEVRSGHDEHLKLKAYLPKGEVEDWLVQFEESLINSNRSAIKTAIQRYQSQLQERSDILGQLPCYAQVVIDNIIWSDLQRQIDQQTLQSFLHEYSMSLTNNLLQSDSLTERLTLQTLILNAAHNLEQSGHCMPMLFAIADEISISFAFHVFVRGHQFIPLGEPLSVSPAVERVWVHMAQVGTALAVAGTSTLKVNACLQWVKILGQFSTLVNADSLTPQNIVGLLKTSSHIFFQQVKNYSHQLLSSLATILAEIQQGLHHKLDEIEVQGCSLSASVVKMPVFLASSSCMEEVPRRLAQSCRVIFFVENSWLYIIQLHLEAIGYESSSKVGMRLYRAFEACEVMLPGFKRNHSALNKLLDLQRKHLIRNPQSLTNDLATIILPSLSKHDYPLFQIILQSTFSTISQGLHSLQQSIVSHGLVSCSYMEHKLHHLLELLSYHRVVVVVGRCRAGKSTLVELSGLELCRTFPDVFEVEEMMGSAGIMEGLFKKNQAIWLDGQLKSWWLDRILIEPLISIYSYQQGQAAFFTGNLILETCTIQAADPVAISKVGLCHIDPCISPTELLENKLEKEGFVETVRKEAVGICERIGMAVFQVQNWLKLVMALPFNEDENKQRAVLIWSSGVLWESQREQWGKCSSIRFRESFFNESGQPISISSQPLFVHPHSQYDQIYLPNKQTRYELHLIKHLINHKVNVSLPVARSGLLYKLDLARIRRKKDLAASADVKKVEGLTIFKMQTGVWLDDVSLHEYGRAMSIGMALSHTRQIFEGSLLIPSPIDSRVASQFLNLPLKPTTLEDNLLSFTQLISSFLTINNFKKEVLDQAEGLCLYLKTCLLDLQYNLPATATRPFSYGIGDLDQVMRAIFGLKGMSLWIDRETFLQHVAWVLKEGVRHKAVTREDTRAQQEAFINGMKSCLKTTIRGNKLACEMSTSKSVIRVDCQKDLEKMAMESISTLKEYSTFFIGQQEIQLIARLLILLKGQRGNVILVGPPGIGKKSIAKMSSHLLGHQFIHPFLTHQQNNSLSIEDVCAKAVVNTILDQKSCLLYFSIERVQNQPVLQAVTDSGIFVEDSANQMVMEAKIKLEERLGDELQIFGLQTHFRRRLWEGIRVVVSARETRGINLPTDIPFTRLSVGHWEQPALVDIALKQLGEGRKEASICGAIFHKIRSLRASTGISLPSSKDYLCMVRLFRQEQRRRKEIAESRRSQLLQGVRKVKLCEQEVDRMSIDLTTFEAEYPQLVDTQQRYQLAVEHQYKAITITKKQVESEKDVLSTEQDNLEIQKETAQRNFHQSRTKLKTTKDALSKLGRNQVSEIKTLYQMHRHIREVLEAVLLLLGQQPTEESIRKVLADPNFLMHLKSVDPDKYNHKSYQNIRAYLDKISFNPEQVKTTSTAAGVIAEWTRDVTDIIRLSLDNRDKKVLLDKQTEAYYSKKQSYEEKCQELERLVQDIKRSEVKLKDSIEKLQFMKSEIEKVKNRLDNAQLLSKALANMKRIWLQQLAEHNPTPWNEALSNAILPELVCLTQPLRNEVKRLFNHLAKQHYLEGEFDLGHADFDIQMTLGVSTDELSKQNMLIIKNKPFCFVSDPEALAFAWLKSMKLEERTEQNIDSQLLQTGMWAIIKEPSQSLIRAVKKRTLKIADSQVCFHPNFRLICYSRKPIAKLSPYVFEGFIVASFEPTQQLIFQKAIQGACQAFQPTTLSDINRLFSQIAQLEHEVMLQQDSLLQELGDNSYLLDNKILVEKLVTAGQMSGSRLQAIKQNTSAFQALREKQEQYSALGRAVCSTAQIFEQFSEVCGYTFSLNRQIIGQFGRLTSPSDSFDQLLYERVSPAIAQEHAMILALMMAFDKDRKTGKLTPQLFDLLITGKLASSPIVPPKKNPALASLSQNQWRKVCNLGQVHEVLGTLQGSMMKSPKEWERWMQSGDIDMMPGQMGMKLDPLLKLVVIRLFRPQKLVDMFSQFILKRLDKKFLERREPTQMLIQQISQTDSLMLAIDCKGDFSQLLQHVANRQQKTLRICDLYTTSLPQEVQEDWLLVINFSSQEVRHLEDHLQHNLFQHNKSSHKPIVILSGNKKDIPAALFRLCPTFLAEKWGLIKADMALTLTQLPTTVLSKQCSTLYSTSKLLYLLALLWAVAKNRGKFGVIGWKGQCLLENSDLELALRIAEEEAEVNQLAQRICQWVCFPKMTEGVDFRMMEKLAEQYCSIQSLSAFNIANVVLPESGSLSDLANMALEIPALQNPFLFGFNYYSKLCFDESWNHQILSHLSCYNPFQSTTSPNSSHTPIAPLLQSLHKLQGRAISHSLVQPTQPVEMVLARQNDEMNRFLQMIGEDIEQIERMERGGKVEERVRHQIEGLKEGRLPEEWCWEGLSRRPAIWVQSLGMKASFIKEIQINRPKSWDLRHFSDPLRFIWAWVAQLTIQGTIPTMPYPFYWTLERHSEPTGIVPDGCLLISGVRAKGVKVLAARGLVEEDQQKLESNCPLLRLCFEDREGSSLLPLRDKKGREAGMVICHIQRAHKNLWQKGCHFLI